MAEEVIYSGELGRGVTPRIGNKVRGKSKLRGRRTYSRQTIVESPNLQIRLMGLAIVKRRHECHRYGSKIKDPSVSPERSQALWLGCYYFKL
jgi:hypothetical protein